MSRLSQVLKQFRQRIESIIRNDGSLPFFSIATVLLVLSKCYGGAMALRVRLYNDDLFSSKTLPCRVISIGNLVAGGTGKTPMAILVTQLIRDMGYRVVVITRGYGGTLEKTGGIVSDGENIFFNAKDAGDEPLLMAKRLTDVPVVVGSCRYEAGQMAMKHFKPDVIVLDDAFQHIRLNRDLNIVLLDCRAPFGNGHILPRGILREPLSALNRADAVVFTRSDERPLSTISGLLPASLPTFYTGHRPVMRKFDREMDSIIEKTEDITTLYGKKALAFAGLANNDQFFDALGEIGCELLRTLSFCDHHRYDVADLDKIAETARSCDADVLLTTLKDAVKLDMNYPWPNELAVIDVEIYFTGDLNPFLSLIDDSLKKN